MTYLFYNWKLVYLSLPYLFLSFPHLPPSIPQTTFNSPCPLGFPLLTVTLVLPKAGRLIQAKLVGFLSQEFELKDKEPG